MEKNAIAFLLLENKAELDQPHSLIEKEIISHAESKKEIITKVYKHTKLSGKSYLYVYRDILNVIDKILELPKQIKLYTNDMEHFKMYTPSNIIKLLEEKANLTHYVSHNNV